MGNNIQIFNNPEFGKIRTTNIKGNPWFVAKDVCEVLEIRKYRDALLRLDDDEKGCPIMVDTPGGPQEMTGISESGLYSLIFQSRKPFAKAFRKWVTGEVLPTLRKTGCYKVAYPYEKKIKNLESLREIDRARLELLQKWILNIQSERDIYFQQVKGCTEILCTRDFSESENMAQLGKLMKSICLDRNITPSALSKLIGEELSWEKLLGIGQGSENLSLSLFFKLLIAMDYSIQFVKNEILID